MKCISLRASLFFLRCFFLSLCLCKTNSSQLFVFIQSKVSSGRLLPPRPAASPQPLLLPFCPICFHQRLVVDEWITAAVCCVFSVLPSTHTISVPQTSASAQTRPDKIQIRFERLRRSHVQVQRLELLLAQEDR